MKSIEVACYSLIASAFLLSALLVVQLGDRVENEANAAQVISKESFTLLTANTRKNEEGLFVLDNTTSLLLIYRLDIARKRLELAGAANMEEVFARAATGDDRRRR